MVKIAGIEIELYDSGVGAPLLFLHSAQGFDANHPFVAMLAKHRRVIAPAHPGFGKSGLPDWMDSVDDFSHVYLELIAQLGLDHIDVVGCSIGGWIAADLATKIPERFRRLVLVAPVGVKTGPSDKLDIPDIFALPQEVVAKLLFHDPGKGKIDMAVTSDETLGIMVRNRETLALVAWEPYMHSPKLKHRLHRATMPTLFLRGASDGVVSAAYLERYAALLPNATITTIAAAGHAPQIEQPEEFTKTVLAFLDA
jgi:pimeloyl-ACP methyl ester carboxylesterase